MKIPLSTAFTLALAIGTSLGASSAQAASNPPIGTFSEKCNVVYGPTTIAPTVVAHDDDYPSFVIFSLDGQQLSGANGLDESAYKAISESNGPMGPSRTFRAGIWDISGLAPGAHKLEAKILDRDGNSTKASSECGADYLVFIVDREPPIVTVNSPSNGFSTSASTIEVTGIVSASGLNTKSVNVNGIAARLTGDKFAATIKMPDPGNWLKININATDEGGNTSDVKTISVYRNTLSTTSSPVPTTVPSESPEATPSESPTPITLTKTSRSPLQNYAVPVVILVLLALAGWVWRAKIIKLIKR